MNFLLDTIYQIAMKNNSPKIFLFSIGSYPHRSESNHETPKIYQDIKSKINKSYDRFEIYRILIDPEYSSQDIMSDNVIKNFDSNTFIFNISITNRSYYSLVDFANFISRMNCLSIIMEFTSIQRHNIENLSQYVYIAPNDCLADTDTIMYYPTIQYDVKLRRYVFYNLENRDILFDEYHRICQKTEFDFNRLLYIRELIKTKFKNIDELYRKMLNYMKVKEDIETNYDKNSNMYSCSKHLLLKRMCGYTYKDCEQVLDNFEKSDYTNLETYLKNIISNILYDCYYIEQTDTCLVPKKYDRSISFQDDAELYKHIIYYRSYFEGQKS